MIWVDAEVPEPTGASTVKHPPGGRIRRRRSRRRRGAVLSGGGARDSLRGAVQQIGGNEFLSVTLDPMRALVRVTRSSTRPQSVDEIVGAFDEAVRLLDGVERSRLRVLIDLRAAPGRNDSEFERAMTPRRLELVRGFRAAAILVQTPVGELQIARISREDGSDASVFSDEAKALAWLASAKG